MQQQRRLHGKTGLSAPAALQQQQGRRALGGVLHQAQALGLEKVGRIQPGYAADLAILSGDFEVENVFVDGEMLYSAE